jgi:hypothetical protein
MNQSRTVGREIARLSAALGGANGQLAALQALTNDDDENKSRASSPPILFSRILPFLYL